MATVEKAPAEVSRVAKWFSTRCVFQWVRPASYEERITIWPAHNIEEAISLSEVEAIAYADRFKLTFLGIVQAYADSV